MSSMYSCDCVGPSLHSSLICLTPPAPGTLGHLLNGEPWPLVPYLLTPPLPGVPHGEDRPSITGKASIIPTVTEATAARTDPTRWQRLWVFLSTWLKHLASGHGTWQSIRIWKWGEVNTLWRNLEHERQETIRKDSYMPLSVPQWWSQGAVLPQPPFGRHIMPTELAMLFNDALPRSRTHKILFPFPPCLALNLALLASHLP